MLTANALTVVPLLTSNDDPDYEVGGDFTTSCQCEEGALVKNIDLNLNIQHTTAGTQFELMLLKDINQNLGALNPSSLFANSASSAERELRKMTLAYKAIFIPTDKLEKNIRLFVRRKALQRIGQIHEDDDLSLAIFNHHASTNGSLQGYGRITVAEN